MRPNGRIRNVEYKIDTLTDQLADLTIVINISHGGVSDGKTDLSDERERMCSFSNKPGDGANIWREKPHRNKKFPHCGKVGHGEATCWSRSKATTENGKGIVIVTLNSDGEDKTDQAGMEGKVVNVNAVVENSDNSATEGKLLPFKRTANGQTVPKQPRSL